MCIGTLVLFAGQPLPPVPPPPKEPPKKAEPKAEPEKKPGEPEKAEPKKEEPKEPKAGTLPEGVVATIDGEPIKKEELLEALYNALAFKGLRDLIDLKLIEREAKKYNVSVTDKEVSDAVDKDIEGIEKRMGDRLTDALKRDLLISKENLKKMILGPNKRRELLLGKCVKAWALEPERVKEEVTKRFTQVFKKEHEYFRACRITLKPDGEELAKKLAADIKAGKISFEDAAKQNSTDRYKVKGGDIGYFRADMYKTQAEFMGCLRSLKVGEVSEPFKTGLGWCIVRLDAHHPANTIELKHVEEFLKKQIENEPPNRGAQGQYLEKLRGSADIVVDYK
jgi:foldase protein PrsA